MAKNYQKKSAFILAFNKQGKLFTLNGEKYKKIRTLPGGKLKDNESFKAAAYREFEEETKINISHIKLKRVGEHFDEASNKKVVCFIALLKEMKDTTCGICELVDPKKLHKNMVPRHRHFINSYLEKNKESRIDHIQKTKDFVLDR